MVIANEPEADWGRISVVQAEADSQRTGLAQLPPHLDASMLLLADQVLLNEADLRDIQAAWAGREPAVHSLYPVLAD